MADGKPQGNPRLTLVAGTLVVVLALGALLWPRSRAAGGVPLLVFDPSGRTDRIARVYEPLAKVIAESTGRPAPLTVVVTVAEFAGMAATVEGFALCPDGVALRLARDSWGPVAVGRRAAPMNLRPRGVLVSRRSAADGEEPWRTRPARTVLGDSLSLTAVGLWDLVADGRGRPGALAVGPDPYDHGPALHAARLGGFDHALVRQWDADRFFAAGLLPETEWEVRPVTVPVPDLVLMASRSLPARLRLETGQQLAALGRGDDDAPVQATLREGLDRLQLAGFNLLIDPDLDLVRRQLRENWPRRDD